MKYVVKFYILMAVSILMGLYIGNSVFGETLGVERDKALHFGASYTAQVLCASMVSEVVKDKQVTNMGCFVAVNALGVAVEHGLLGDNTKDAKDIGANLLGSGLGVLTVEWKF